MEELSAPVTEDITTMLYSCARLAFMSLGFVVFSASLAWGRNWTQLCGSRFDEAQTVANASVTRSRKDCPADFTAVSLKVNGGVRYDMCWTLLDSQGIVAYDCAQRCRTFHGAEMLTIRYPEVNELIVKELEASCLNTAWLSLVHVHGQWKWTSTSMESQPTFQNWGMGEPNNAGCSEHCSKITLWGEAGVWYDDSAFVPANCFCMIENATRADVALIDNVTKYKAEPWQQKKPELDWKSNTCVLQEVPQEGEDRGPWLGLFITGLAMGVLVALALSLFDLETFRSKVGVSTLPMRERSVALESFQNAVKLTEQVEHDTALMFAEQLDTSGIRIKFVVGRAERKVTVDRRTKLTKSSHTTRASVRQTPWTGR